MDIFRNLGSTYQPQARIQSSPYCGTNTINHALQNNRLTYKHQPASAKKARRSNIGLRPIRPDARERFKLGTRQLRRNHRQMPNRVARQYSSAISHSSARLALVLSNAHPGAGGANRKLIIRLYSMSKFVLKVNHLFIARWSFSSGQLKSIVFTDCIQQAHKFAFRLEAATINRILKRFCNIRSKIEKIEN